MTLSLPVCLLETPTPSGCMPKSIGATWRCWCWRSLWYIPSFSFWRLFVCTTLVLRTYAYYEIGWVISSYICMYFSNLLNQCLIARCYERWTYTGVGGLDFLLLIYFILHFILWLAEISSFDILDFIYFVLNRFEQTV